MLHPIVNTKVAYWVCPIQIICNFFCVKMRGIVCFLGCFISGNNLPFHMLHVEKQWLFYGDSFKEMQPL